MWEIRVQYDNGNKNDSGVNSLAVVDRVVMMR